MTSAPVPPRPAYPPPAPAARRGPRPRWWVVAVAGVVVALVLAAITALLPRASIINETTGAIAVGSGPNTLDVYVDFMCPVCGQFEQFYGEEIQTQVEDGQLTLNVHPIAILDRYSQGTQYSTRSASAMYCVADHAPRRALAFMQALYAQQPAENTAGLSDTQLIRIAKRVGADGAADCISTTQYGTLVTRLTTKTPVPPGRSGIGTPTVLLNNEFVELTGDPRADIVARFK